MEPSKKLVIDTSVARSSGGAESTYPLSIHCRDFLQAVLAHVHHLVLSPDIQAEWNKHQSNFARRWRLSMVARKKVFFIKGSPSDEKLRVTITAISTEKESAAMIKDCLLVEAALVTDHTVASLDQIVRQLFARVSDKIIKLKPIVWVNPDKAAETPLEWLKAGAKPEKHRTLGYKAPTP